MDQNMISKQMQINKMAYRNTFNSMSIMQGQIERMINIYIDQVPMISAEGKKIIMDWTNTCKKVQQMSLSIYSHTDEDRQPH
jgi:hypothetical protein